MQGNAAEAPNSPPHLQQELDRWPENAKMSRTFIKALKKRQAINDNLDKMKDASKTSARCSP